MTFEREYPTTYNAGAELLDRYVTEGIDGDKLAFVSATGSLNFDQLKDRASRVGSLLNRFGLVQEQRVAMLVHDCPEFPVFFLGAIRAGFIPIPLNTLLTTEQYKLILQDAGVTAVCVSAPLLEMVRGIVSEVSSVQAVFVCGHDDGLELSEGTFSLANELDASAVSEPAATHRDSTAFWLYSSGSTGSPKGVRHVHTSMMETARLYGQDVLGLREDDVVYSAAKLFFAYGLGNALSFPLRAGATAVLHDARPTPDAVMANMREFQPTVFFGAPTLFAGMLADETCTPENGSKRLRLCVSAGEALPKDIGDRWKERFGCDIVDGVGSTEMLHIFLSNSPEHIHYGTSGKAVPGYDVRLVDEHDNDVQDDEIGELLVRGSTSADGYWNQREKSRSTFVGEWTRTGDKYTRDSAGLYTYSGRTDDMFKVSGQWVSPFEVESALISHASVIEAAVIPYEDDDDLIKPKAFIVAAPGHAFDYELLKEHVQNQIGKWKYPRWIDVVDDLPKTATGKIQRFKLRDLS